MKSYSTAFAFRRALEDRLNAASKAEGVDHKGERGHEYTSGASITNCGKDEGRDSFKGL